MKQATKRVVVFGGGFSGVKAALDLAKFRRFDVTFISDNDEFKIAARVLHILGAAKDTYAAIPYKKIFQGSGVHVVQDSVVSIDKTIKEVVTMVGARYAYDELIIALSGVPNHYGLPVVGDLAYSVSTPSEVKRLHNHIHDLITNGKSQPLNFAIVGAGITGIETAGWLGDFALSILDAHNLGYRHVHIDLLEEATRIAPALSPHIARVIARRLRNLGVHIRTKTHVAGISDTGQVLIDGKPLMGHTLIWAGGVMPHPFFAANGFRTGARGRAEVDSYLQAAPSIYIIGDDTGTAYNGTAGNAIKDGAYIADNIYRKSEGLLMKRYEKHRPRLYIPVGQKWTAVGQNRRWIYGMLGWLLQTPLSRASYAEAVPWFKNAGNVKGRQKLSKCPVCSQQS